MVADTFSSFNKDVYKIDKHQGKYKALCQRNGKVKVYRDGRRAREFKERIRNFPCQMPLTLVERVINASSNNDDVVLDPFIGSGTTAVACKKLGRKYIGIDISKNYVKNVENRLRGVL